MDVARPLTVLVPSLDGPVLEALARTSRPVTGREAHRLAGAGSESGVRLVLARLVEHGLVNATQAGKATLYVANREHIAWPLVEGLVKSLFILQTALSNQTPCFFTDCSIRALLEWSHLGQGSLLSLEHHTH